MLKFVFAFILLIHGLVHFIGFAKAFGYSNITQLTGDISKPSGLFWFLTADLFITATVLFLLKKDAWLVVAVIAVVASQVLTVIAWKDAKFGTIANALILSFVIYYWWKGNTS